MPPPPRPAPTRAGISGSFATTKPRSTVSKPTPGVAKGSMLGGQVVYKKVGASGGSQKKLYTATNVSAYDSDDDPFAESSQTQPFGEKELGYHLNGERKERVRDLRKEEQSRDMFMDEIDDDGNEIIGRQRPYEQMDPLIDMLLEEEDQTEMFTKAKDRSAEPTKFMLQNIDAIMHTPRDGSDTASTAPSEGSTASTIGRMKPWTAPRTREQELNIFMQTGNLPMGRRSSALGVRPSSRASTTSVNAGKENSAGMKKASLSRAGKGLGDMSDRLVSDSKRTAMNLRRKQELIDEALAQATGQLRNLQSESDDIQKKYMDKRQEMLRLERRAYRVNGSTSPEDDYDF